MKRCPKGHIYPDTLSECPLCAKSEALQTRFYKPVAKSRPPAVEPVVSQGVKPAFSGDDKKKSNALKNFNTDNGRIVTDVDQTIILGQAGVGGIPAGIGGWLVELNNDGIPIKSHELHIHRKHHIGRGADNDIVLPNNRQSISRRHCMIEYHAPYFIIHDNNSANGTKVDDAPVTSQALEDMSSVMLGDQKFWIKYLRAPIR